MTTSFRFSKPRQIGPFFGIFNELLSIQNVNVARFACNVECDLSVIFKHCGQSQKITDEVATNECNDVSNDDSAFIFVIIP